jgi:hypothetical protein
MSTAPPTAAPPTAPPSSGQAKKSPNLLLVILAVVFFPVSLTYLLLRAVWRGKIQTGIKWAITGFVGLFWLVLLVVSAGSGGNVTSTATSNQPAASSSARAATPSAAAATQPTTTPAPAASLKPSPTPVPKPQFATFQDGTFVVGKDIQPGTYRTRNGSSGCYFARLKGFGGSVDDILANENTDAPAVVTITPTDKGFDSSRCGTWTSDLSAITESRISFTDGDLIVGTDIQPGTYRSTGQSGCYWARLQSFGHTTDDVLANDNTDNPAVVTIAPTDKGFEATRCGTWTLVG